MLTADLFASFGCASIILNSDSSRAGGLSAVGFGLLLVSITLIGPYMISMGAQALNAAVPSLGPTAAWVGLQGFAAVIGIALGLVTAASLPVALIALAAGAVLGASLRFGR